MTSAGPIASTRSLRSPNSAGLSYLSTAVTVTDASRPAMPTSMPPGLSFSPLSFTRLRAGSAGAGVSVSRSGAPGRLFLGMPPHHCLCVSVANTRSSYSPHSVARNLAICHVASGSDSSATTSASTIPGPSPSATMTSGDAEGSCAPGPGGLIGLPNMSWQLTLTSSGVPAVHPSTDAGSSTVHELGSNAHGTQRT